MARTGTKRKKLTPSIDACEALVSIAGGAIDREKIAALIGDRTVRTLADVARAFRVSAATVRQSWRQNGMPGESSAYNLVDVTLWLIGRNDRLADQQQNGRADPITTEKRRLELRQLELVVAEREAKADIAAGRAAPLDQVQREQMAMIVVARESLMKIPRRIMPMVPTNVADKTAGEVERLIRNVLTALSEKTGRQYLNESAKIERQNGKK